MSWYCDEADLFPLIAMGGVPIDAGNFQLSPNCWERISQVVGQNPFFPGYPDHQKRYRNIVLSFSHDSVTTARLRTYNMSRDRLQQSAANGQEIK
ncbi:hypothetical protein TNCV_1011011 [Trichonephila clavipes]|uniref:Uncharacterized protein n=1 Tax=Trichonephila clavipes TaxID=2585209 RepID=A0A8X7B9J3_TRICX|nr:hypothetical protein TNCV_1011011 [Trichonephila clavipes]